MFKTLRALFKLSRPALLPVSASVPAAGALTHGQPVPDTTLLALLLVGVCAHLFGFVMNDLIDTQLDRTTPLRENSPLIKGTVKRWQAVLFCLVQIPLAMTLYLLVGGIFNGLAVIALSITLSLVYNRWSKWGRIPRLFAELCLAAAIGLLCMAGALVMTPELPFRTLLFSLSVLLVLLLVNSVPSGLKDILSDSQYGARSFVIAMGAQADETENLMIPHRLKVYAWAIQGCIVVSVLLMILVYHPGGLAGLLSLVCVIYGGLHLRLILSAPDLDSFFAARAFLGGFYNYFAVSLFVYPSLPGLLKVIYALFLLNLLLIPVRAARRTWKNRNRVLYGASGMSIKTGR